MTQKAVRLLPEQRRANARVHFHFGYSRLNHCDQIKHDIANAYQAWIMLYMIQMNSKPTETS
jgi:hypothetical protein